MKLLYKLRILLLFFPITICAQQINGTITYRYILNLNGVASTQTAYLYFNNTESVFIHSKGKKGNVLKTEDGKDWDGESLPSKLGGWYQDTIGAVIYKNIKDKKLYIREFFYSVPYLVEEPNLPTITWVITDEKKLLGKFKCQKAKADFRGRSYTVWFTLDIPISNGPWKLQGLPGLILEAFDDSNEVNFLFTSIEIPSPPFNNQPPNDGKKVTFDTYKKADDIEFDRYKKATESQDLGRGGKMSVSRGKKNLIEKTYEQ